MCGAGKPCSALVTGKCLTRGVIWRGNRWKCHWHAGGTCWLAAAAVTRPLLDETAEVINLHWSVAKGGGVCCFYPPPISADVFPQRWSCSEGGQISSCRSWNVTSNSNAGSIFKHIFMNGIKKLSHFVIMWWFQQRVFFTKKELANLQTF